MPKIYIFLLFFYATWLNAMDIEKVTKHLTNDQTETSKFVEGVFSPQKFPIIATKLIQAIKNKSTDAAELARTIPEDILQDLLLKAARMYPIDQEYNGSPTSQRLERYRRCLKKFNNEFITFILFQSWAGTHIKKLNQIAIWGQHATERALFRAIKKDHIINRIAIITTLLDNNTNGNTTKAHRKAYTPFAKAIEKERFDVLDLLRNKCANAQRTSLPPVWQQDLKNNTDLENKLYAAVINGDCNLATQLLDQGAKIQGAALLSIAIECGHHDMAVLLIHKGADVNLGNPLNKAIKKKYTRVASLLIRCNADISKGDPLALAALRGLYDIVSLLIDIGADLNNGAPLAKAIGRKYFNIAALLIEKGADVNLENPLKIAIKKGGTNVAISLIENGADVNQDNPLLAAIEAGNIKIAERLIEKGADVNEGNPLAEASLRCYKGLVNLLIKKGATISSTRNSQLPSSKKRKYSNMVHVTFP